MEFHGLSHSPGLHQEKDIWRKTCRLGIRIAVVTPNKCETADMHEGTEKVVCCGTLHLRTQFGFSVEIST